MRGERLVACALSAASFLAAGCAHDEVLPDAVEVNVCGDHVVGPAEQCDDDSPGCTNCMATPGYECDGTACYIPCGNGVKGSGPHCDGAAKTTECDMTGWWVSRETDFTRDEVLGAVLTASTWYLYRFSQTGDAFQVEEELHCGIHVTGSATVDYARGTLQGLMYENDQTPMGTHGPRRGRFVREGAGCSFSIDRWYGVRGGDPRLLPDDFATKPALAALPALPSVPDPLHPPGGMLPGATDPDGNGLPGAAYLLSGIVSGTRDSIQRDYKEYATPAGQPIAPGSVTFVAPGSFDLEESILSVTKCDACALIASKAFVDPTLVPRVTLRFLGTTMDGPGVASVVGAVPRADVNLDTATCDNVRLVLPHDPSTQ